MQVSDDQFAALIAEAFERLPKTHRKAIKNVAILYADEPTPLQREQLRLRDDQTLFGLYEGTPLPRRHGRTLYMPDKITLFKLPMLAAVATAAELREQIYHTLWHEVAHYFGLDHKMIRDRE